MGVFIVYMIKSSVCIALFYMLYMLILRKSTFHTLNRFGLLFIYLLSLVLPLIEIRASYSSPIQNAIVVLENSFEKIDREFVYNHEFVVEDSARTFNAEYIIAIVYLLGLIFFLLRGVYSYVRMFIFLSRSEKIRREDGNILVLHQENISPFSWMKYVVVSRKDYEENGGTILIHELAHVKLKHSLDLIFSEFLTVLQWFNPAAWLMKFELKHVHEFQADDMVINSGTDAKTYQLLLIEKAVGSQRFNSMTNSFNHNNLKKRITMMLKQRSKPWTRWRYLCLLPLSTIVVAAFAQPKISEKFESLSNVEFINYKDTGEIKFLSSNGMEVFFIRTLDNQLSIKTKFSDGTPGEINVGEFDDYDAVLEANIVYVDLIKDGVKKKGSLHIELDRIKYISDELYVVAVANDFAHTEVSLNPIVFSNHPKQMDIKYADKLSFHADDLVVFHFEYDENHPAYVVVRNQIMYLEYDDREREVVNFGDETNIVYYLDSKKIDSKVLNNDSKVYFDEIRIEVVNGDDKKPKNVIIKSRKKLNE